MKIKDRILGRDNTFFYNLIFSIWKVFELRINLIQNAKIVEGVFDLNEKSHKRSVFKIDYCFLKNNRSCVQIKIRVEIF